MFATWLGRVSVTGLLFLLCFSIYQFTMAGVIQYGDEMEKFRVAQSIVERGEFSFRPTAQRNAIGVGGRTFSGYELGQTLIEIPFYTLGKLADQVFPVPDANGLTMLCVGLLNPLLTALSVVLFFTLSAHFGFGFKTSLGLACVLGVATILFPYSRGFTREPLLTFLLLLSLFAAFKFSQTNASRWLLFTGLALGFLAFTKFIQGVVIPVFLVYLVLVIVQRERQAGANRTQILGAIARGVLVVILPGLAFLIIQSIYAFARFGTFTSGLGGLARNPIDVILQLIPLGNPLQALGGLLFSSDKSLFLYSPPIILGLVGGWHWLRLQRREPRSVLWLILGLILAEFASVIFRPDWDGGSWWGPRYLVQITPLLVLPIGFLFTSDRSSNRTWGIVLGSLGAIGFLIQSIGAFVSDRDYLDAMGSGSVLWGQSTFLLQGAIDSLVLSLSLDGFPVRINPFGVLLIAIILFLVCLIIQRWRQGVAPSSWRVSGIFLVGVLLIEAAGFVGWVVAPYTQVIAAKGDTRFVVANNLLAAGKQCQAFVYYTKALELETNASRQAAIQIEKLWPPSAGKTIQIHDPTYWMEGQGKATFEEDLAATITGNGSFRFEAPPAADASFAITSEPLPASPNAQYELSGWLKSLEIYGSGYGVVSVFEDNGDWGDGRTTDIRTIDETSGWQFFRKTVTTLPTTQRLFVKSGLFKTYGILWVDNLELIRVDSSVPQPQRQPPCE